MRGLLGWVNELPPLGRPGDQCLEESVDQYQQARGMCIQQRGHEGPHRTDAMRAEARGEKYVPRYQPDRSRWPPIMGGMSAALGAWDNAYSAPEKLGLVLVGEVSFDDESYQFDLGAVWWSPERRVFFYVEDSGCSCPSPYEEYRDVESLGEPLTLHALTGKLRTLAPREWRPPAEPLAVQVEPILYRAAELDRG